MKKTFVASGNVPPMRFVKQDTSADGKALVCGAGDRITGVSQKGVRRLDLQGTTLNDGYCAIAGSQFEVAMQDERVPLELGGTVSAGDRLKSGALGVGVATTTNLDEWGAIADQAGVSGDIIEVIVKPYGQISAA